MRRLRPPLLPLLALLLCLPAAAGAAERARDYLIRRGDAVFGHSRVTRAETRELISLDSEQRVRFTLLSTDQEVRERMRMTVDRRSGTRVVELAAETLFKSRSIEIAIDGRTARLTDRIAGETQTYEADAPLYFDIDRLLDVDLSKLKKGDRLAWRVIDPETRRLETMAVEVRAHAPGALTLAVSRPLYESTETYDDALDLVRAEMPALGLVIERAAGGEDAAAAAGRFDVRGGDLLEFPTAIRAADLARAKSLRAGLAFRDLPVESFNFEDARQSFEIVSTRGGTTEVRLVVRRIDFTRELDRPIAGIERTGGETYLAPTPLVRSESRAAAALRAEILAGETNLLRAVERSCAWVASNVRPAILPDTLSSDEVLEGRRGMCMQYGTLLAAILRGAGIRTRCAMGLKWSDGRFLPHLYNEVWNGLTWIPVDATDAPGPPGRLAPSIIKLAHGNDLVDLARLKSRLLNNLTLLDASVE